MRFVHPEVGWLLLLVPLLLWLIRVQYRRRTQIVQYLGDPGLLQQTPGWVPRLHQPWAQRFLVILPVLCLLGALADPRVPYGASRLRAGMLDTVIILDVSKSMAAEDYHQQSRLAKARSLVRGLFPALPGNRVGMVTFAGNSFRQAELTADLSALDYILQHWIDINTAGLGGSNLVQALETGLALFPDAPQRQQVIFLFSDGGEGNEEFHTVLDKAVQRGIRINTVGLGGLQPARIPQYDAQHRFQGFLRIDGQVVTTSLLEAPLQHIASAAHGTYQRIAPGTSESHILTQAAGVANTMAREEYRLFQPFLLAGLLACGLQGLLARI